MGKKKTRARISSQYAIGPYMLFVIMYMSNLLDENKQRKNTISQLLFSTYTV